MMMRCGARGWVALAWAAFGCLGVVGCGGTYQPGRASSFEVDASAEINDDEVRKAFEARPQLPDQLHVAYYTFDPEKAKAIEDMLHGLPGVASVYRIPPLIVNGQRRLDEQNPWAPPREVSVKKLRLLAARAHADVLFVVDHGYRIAGVNGLAALNILLVPVLFMPFIDNTVEGYTEAFLLDTRNGYLYGHVAEDDKRGDAWSTIYSKKGSDIAEEQWATLSALLTKDLTRLLAEERAHSKEAKAAPKAVKEGGCAEPAAPATAPSPAAAR